MKANQFSVRWASRLLSVLLLCMLWPTNALYSQIVYNAGVDMEKLSTPGHYIYFGHYDHATNIPNDGTTVNTREGTARPILWRVMGKEDGAITLMSEYVLDTATYSSTTKEIAWLNTPAFIDSFTPKEQALIMESDVYTPTYKTTSITDLTGSDPVLDTVSSTSMKFYLPWGTPPRRYGVKGNKVLWTLGNTGGDFENTDTLAIQGSGPRGGLGFDVTEGTTVTNVRYWLRSLIKGADQKVDQALVVQLDGSISSRSFDVPAGVRPMFGLNPENVLFASELKKDTTMWNQIKSDTQKADYNYRDDDQITNGKSGTGAAYKLTVLNEDIKINFGTPTLDLDDTITSGSSTVYIRPGKTVSCKVTNVSANATKLVYKIVDDNSLKRYEDAQIQQGKDTFVNLAAKNIYRDNDEINAGNLSPGIDYTAYIWAQKDNPTQSNEGSEPKQFTLKVRNDETAPVLSPVGNVYRSYVEQYRGDTAIVKFKIDELLGGKYYYYVTKEPLQPEPSAEALITKALTASGSLELPGTNNNPELASGKIAFPATTTGTYEETITLYFGSGNNNPYHMYIAAKDSVRNTSAVLHILIPEYIPNNKPVAKKNYVLTLEAGQEEGKAGKDTILRATDIADDNVNPPDSKDSMIITQIVNDDPIMILDKTVADTFLVDGKLTIRPYTPGSTTIKVVVDDRTKIPPYADRLDTAIIEIAVREATPDAKIKFETEELELWWPGHYLIGGDTVEIPADSTTLPIADKWFGTTLPIIRIQPGKPNVNSLAKMLPIPRRPAAPELTPTNESFNGYKDGQIYGVSTEMEYKLDTMNWIPIPSRRIFENLAPGVYQIRMKVVPDTSFVGDIARITIREGVSAPAIMRAVYMPEVAGITTNPAAGIRYVSSTNDFIFAVKFSNKVTPVRTSRIINGVQEVLSGVINVEGGYTYTIRNVQERVAIYLDPDVGTVEVEAEEQSAVWSTSGQVYVRTDREDTAVIYGLTGRIVKRAELSEGTTAIPLRAGLYVVTLQKSGIRRKVLIQ